MIDFLDIRFLASRMLLLDWILWLHLSSTTFLSLLKFKSYLQFSHLIQLLLLFQTQVLTLSINHFFRLEELLIKFFRLSFVFIPCPLIFEISGNNISSLLFIGFKTFLNHWHLSYNINFVIIIIITVILRSHDTADLLVETKYEAFKFLHLFDICRFFNLLNLPWTFNWISMLILCHIVIDPFDTLTLAQTIGYCGQAERRSGFFISAITVPFHLCHLSFQDGLLNTFLMNHLFKVCVVLL